MFSNYVVSPKQVLWPEKLVVGIAPVSSLPTFCWPWKILPDEALNQIEGGKSTTSLAGVLDSFVVGGTFQGLKKTLGSSGVPVFSQKVEKFCEK